MGDPEPVGAIVSTGAAGKRTAVPALHDAAARDDVALVQSLLSSPSHSVDELDASGASALLVAAREGHCAVVELLVAHGADVALKNQNQSTALQFASLHGHTAVATFLLTHQSDASVVQQIDDMNTSGYSALHCAAREGHAEIAQLLLDHGANVEVTSDGWHPLHTACVKNHVEIVRLLLSRGANVNAAMGDGVTPLHHAALHGSMELAELLLNAGAGAETCAGESHMSPLHLAALRGDVAMIEILVGSGAQTDSESAVGTMPFYTAAQHGHLDAVKLLTGVDTQWKERKSPIHVVTANGFTDVLKFLIAEGVDVDLRDEYGLTPLCVAVVSDQVDALHVLIAAGANVNVLNQQAGDYTVLHYAAELGREEAMKALIVTGGGDVHVKNDTGHTSFLVAALHGHVGVLSVLLENGADPLVGEDEFSAAHLAATTGQLQVLEYLLANGLTRDFEKETNGVSPLSLAASAGHIGVVQFLVEYQVSNNSSHTRETQLALRTEALTGAIEGDQLEIVRLLCENGASVDMLATKDTTALHTAAAVGSTEVVEYLLDVQHADLQTRNSAGLTALLYAATAGHSHIVGVLIAHGAPVDEAVDHSVNPELNGTTSVHFAALYGYVDVLETLLKHGANINAKTSQGTGALECARECDNTEEIPRVVEFLVAHGAVEE
ncbi:hypothetical protein Gpo141_00012972 [Globisporangium polare]